MAKKQRSTNKTNDLESFIYDLWEIREIDTNSIPKIVEKFTTMKFDLLVGLRNNQGKLRPRVLCEQDICIICILDCFIFISINQFFPRSKIKMKHTMDNWWPFLGEKGFNEYKVRVEEKGEYLTESETTEILMIDGNKKQSWSQVVTPIVDRSLVQVVATALSDPLVFDDAVAYLRRNKTHNQHQLFSDPKNTKIFLRFMKDNYGVSAHPGIGKKMDLNDDIWVVAAELRDRKEKGEFETYQKAYEYGARNYNVKGNPITTKQLANNYYKKKSTGEVKKKERN